MFRFVLLAFFFTFFSGSVLAGNGNAIPVLRSSLTIDHLPSPGCCVLCADADTIPTAGNGLSASSDSILERKDSVITSGKKKKSRKADYNIYKDTVLKPGANPRRATIYSAVLPGLGQIYNRKYWKLPLVYAAVGIPAYFFFDNKKWYQRCQYALTVTFNRSPADSVAKVNKSLLPFVNANDINGLITYRNSFRKDQDYSVLFFLLFYGLQVVDATVDAHLKGFNVNDDLTLHITPTLLSSSSNLAGISLVFDIHKPVPRPLRMN